MNEFVQNILYFIIDNLYILIFLSNIFTILREIKQDILFILLNFIHNVEK